MGIADPAVEMWYRITVLGLILVTASACRPSPDRDAMSEAAPPPAAVIAPVGESTSLGQQLARLDRELAATIRLLAQNVDRDDATARLHRAESITDGLLEAQAPFEWLATDYSVEARLRQLQARADRIVAEQRRGAAAEQLLVGVRGLRDEVGWLRRALAQDGGGEAPPPLDTLLAAPPRDSLPERAATPG